LLFGGIGVALVIALVVVIALVAGSGDDGGQSASGAATSAGSDDEAAIRQLFDDFNDATMADQLQYVCAGDVELLESMGGLGTLPDRRNPAGDAATISGIEVRGDTASAQVTTPRRTEQAHFAKEDGEWKVCETAGPNPPRAPR
jgi:hypothetical protein